MYIKHCHKISEKSSFFFYEINRNTKNVGVSRPSERPTATYSLIRTDNIKNKHESAFM